MRGKQAIKSTYEFIGHFPYWQGFHLIRLDTHQTPLALCFQEHHLYEWILFAGFWEVRKWAERQRLNQQNAA